VNNNYEKRITEIFCKVIGLSTSEVNDETAYDSCASWDSLRHLAFISKFEEEFDIDIDTDDIIAMETFKKVKEITLKYISEK